MLFPEFILELIIVLDLVTWIPRFQLLSFLTVVENPLCAQGRIQDGAQIITQALRLDRVLRNFAVLRGPARAHFALGKHHHLSLKKRELDCLVPVVQKCQGLECCSHFLPPFTLKGLHKLMRNISLDLLHKNLSVAVYEAMILFSDVLECSFKCSGFINDGICDQLPKFKKLVAVVLLHP